MRNILTTVLILIISMFLAYSCVGSKAEVNNIKTLAPAAIHERGWRVLRYEGYQYGSWGNHGGKVWYHVQDTANPNIQYRVFITIWENELHFHYNGPEVLQRIELNSIKQ